MPGAPRLKVEGGRRHAVLGIQNIQVEVGVRAAPVVIPSHLQRNQPAAVERVGFVAGGELHYVVAVGVGVLARP